jgi:DNA-binding CsgD family transcriptional regulator
MEAIASHLDRLTSLSKLLSERHDAAARSLAVLDRFPFGLLIVDRDRIVRGANRLGRELLHKYSVFTIRQDRISAGAPHRADLDRLLDWSEQASVQLPFRAVRTSAPGGRSIWLVSWCISNAGPSGPHRLFVIVVSDGRGVEPSQTVLQRCFGLTPGESRVAALIATGRSARDVAQSLGISHEAVRFHLKNAMSKTSVSRQPDLVRVMLASPAGLAEPSRHR